MTNPYVITLLPEYGDELLYLTTHVSELEKKLNSGKTPEVEFLDDYLFPGYMVKHAMSPTPLVEKVIYGFLHHNNIIARTEMMPQKDAHPYRWNPLLIGEKIPVIDPEMDYGNLEKKHLSFYEVSDLNSTVIASETFTQSGNLLLGKYHNLDSTDNYLVLSQGRKMLPQVASRIRKQLDGKK